MSDSIKMAGAALVGAGIGFFVGFKLTERKLQARFDERLEDETRGMREFYQSVKQPYATPQEAVEKLIPPKAKVDPRTPNAGKVQYHKVPASQPEEEEIIPPQPPVVENIFEKNTGPQLITQEEFMMNNPEHQQATLTYYEKSDQVCGENDEPIDKQDQVVGYEFKRKFGWGSSDKNIVHVRHNGLEMDFEIVRSEGSYEEEVLGEEPPDLSIPPHKRASG